MQRDMKLQQMQMSTTSGFLSFSAKSGLGLDQKTVLRVAFIRNIISSSPELTRELLLFHL